MDKLNQLKYSEIDFERIFDLSPDLIFILDRDHNIIRANQTMAERVGVSSVSLVGSKCFWCIHQTDKPPAFCVHSQMLKDGKEHLAEIFIEHLGGWFSVTASPLRNKEGTIIGAIHIARDFTERKRIERMLQEEHENFQSVVSNIPVAIWSADIGEDGAFENTYTSTVFDELLGLPVGTLKNDWNKYFSYIKPEYLERINIAFGKAIESPGTIIESEFEVVKANGKTAWFYSRGRCYEKSGKLFVFGTTDDITEQKKAENKLLFLSKAVDSTSDAIGISDAEGHHIYQNKAFSDLFGYATAEELEAVGGGKAAVKDPDVTKEIFQHIMSGKSYSGEWEMVKKNGQVFPVYERTDAIKDEDGNIIGLIGIITDSTERKKAEKVLIESEEKYRLLYESNKMPISIFDSKTLSFLSVNNAFIEKYGYTREEFLNMTILDIRPESEIEKLKQSVKIVDKGLANAGIFLHKKKNGEIIQVEIIRYDLVFDGKNAKLVFANDVTDKIQAENDLLQANYDLTLAKELAEESNKELEELNNTKDKFFSIIAHDLRSPFNSFLGFTKMLAQDLPTMTQDQIQKIAVSMRKSATNLYDLLGNLLEWSLLQRGVTTFSPISFLLMTKTAESIPSVVESATKKEVEISYNIPEDLVVYADENMLGSILRNLSSNAVKFTPKGGKVTVAAKPNSDSSVEISIQDTGIGMNKEMMDNLFQLDIDTSRKGTNNEPSTGLGLIICKEFVKKHGGIIWVESEEGKGSIFHFTLPAKASN